MFHRFSQPLCEKPYRFKHIWKAFKCQFFLDFSRESMGSVKDCFSLKCFSGRVSADASSNFLYKILIFPISDGHACPDTPSQCDQFTRCVNCNRILQMLRITNQQNPLPLPYRTALSVPKVPACEQQQTIYDILYQLNA